MHWFRNLKIRSKLLVSFSLVALIAFMIGMLGIRSIKIVDSELNDMYKNETVPVSNLADLGERFREVRIGLRDAILAKTRAEAEAADERTRTAAGKAVEAAASFKKQANSSDIKAAFNSFMEEEAKFDPIRDQILKLSVAGKNAQALTLMHGEAKDIVARQQAYVDKMKELKIEESKKAAEDGATISNNAENTMFLLAFVGIAVALGLGVVISKVIGNPIAELTKAADKLAVGDMSAEVNADTDDEVGQMSRSMAEMIKSIRGLVNEAGKLTQAAAAGKLDIRGSSDQFKGAYRDIITGLNETMDTVVIPLRTLSSTVST